VPILLKFNQLFPLWAVLLSAIAFFASDLFIPMQGLIVPLLSMVMFLMGLTLGVEDFARIIRRPRAVFVGVTLQFLLMPLLALTLANMLQLSNQLTIGMVLVGSCAGGTASNVICYLAKADVALSVSMTVTSTLIGVLATPLLCSFYLGTSVDVDTLGLLWSILQMVLIPVVAGTLCNYFFQPLINRIEPVFPSFTVLLILLIIAIVVALNAERLVDIGMLTLIAVILHNITGLAGGYSLSRLLGFDIVQSQTIAIEVGMQNSGLGVALALQFFSATAALPGAMFSVWHNISGSLLASYWGAKRSSLEYLLQDELLHTKNFE